MKKNIKYIVAAVAGLWLTGCTDDLDRFPLSSLSPETYFNTEEELETFTNHFYSQFPGAASGYGESEDIVNIFTLPATTIGLTRTVPTKGGGWNWDYLREINLYLKYSHRCNNKIAREHYDGIARFFRAYFYFEKVKRFGDVPWYNKPLESNDPDLKKPRDSRQLGRLWPSSREYACSKEHSVNTMESQDTKHSSKNAPPSPNDLSMRALTASTRRETNPIETFLPR